jgi:hypothetical protein
LCELAGTMEYLTLDLRSEVALRPRGIATTTGVTPLPASGEQKGAVSELNRAAYAIEESNTY